MRDTDAIDSIIGALYETISGPAGAPRDWERFRKLFLPGARLVRTAVGDSGRLQAGSLTVEEFTRMADSFFQTQGFYEREIGRRAHSFGGIAQVFSAYEARLTPTAAPVARGINSIQLFDDGTRWWVVNMLWADEREGSQIPAEMLSSAAEGL